MPYIGRDIRTGAFRQLDDISSGFDGSDTTHTMQVNSTNVSVGDVNQILLSLGGVIQKPGTDFTVSGSTLTFTTAPAANTSFFAILLGSDNGGTVTPTDSSVTPGKLSFTDGATIQFGNDDDVELTHNADKGLILKHTATADDKPVSLTLQTGETDLAANDVIGKIEFQAPDEATGTDANLVSAEIRAISEGDFSSSANATALLLMTGASEAATEKMRITSAGRIGIGTATLDSNAQLQIEGSEEYFVMKHTGQMGIKLYGDDTNVLYSYDKSADSLTGGITFGHNDGNIYFYTGGSNARMHIGGSGHVGIGTTTTSNKLRILQNQADENCVQIEYDTSSADESVMRWFCDRAANVAWDFLQAYSNNASSADLEFQMTSAGTMSADGSFSGSGADYAEYFETADGNAITIGKTVVLDGNKVRASTSSDDASTIIGVVRPKEDGKCSMTIGNTAWNHWTNKYLTDDFGVFIWEDYTVKEWTETINNADGTVTTKEHSYPSDFIPEGVTAPADAKVLTQQRKKQNPDWNEDTEYVKRQDRKEWVIIGLLGQIPINKNEKTGTNWVKMRDISDTVEEWLVR
jgi:hypothetical protein